MLGESGAALVHTDLAGQPEPVPQRRALAAMAIAAALLAGIGIAGWAWLSHRGIDAHSARAGLVAVAPAQRPVVPRVTGGFRWAAPPDTLRGEGPSGTSANWGYLAPADELRRRADEDPRVENLAALGVAHLLLGNPQAAVETLQRAVSVAPVVDGAPVVDAALLTDLAAAELVVGERERSLAHLERALRHLESAIAYRPDLLEARFDHALALTALGRDAEARAAWEAYLRLDGSSPWAREARERLQALAP